MDTSDINLTYQSNSRSINDASLNSLSETRKLSHRSVDRALIANLNTNSIRNAFCQLKDTVLKYIKILILTETKLNETFLISQFLIDGFFKSCSFDRNKHSGGVMVYIWDTTPGTSFQKNIVVQKVLSAFL